MKNLLAYTPETFDNLELENFEYAPLDGEIDMEEGFVRGKQSRPRMARIKTMPRRSIASSLRKPGRIPRFPQIPPRQPMRPLLPLPRIGAAASINVFPLADDRRPSGQSSSSGNAGGEGSFGNAPAQDVSSEHVRWVQETLNRALGLRLIVDGIMNRETRSAVRMFQERKGLPVTGLVGPDTEEALRAEGGQAAAEFELLEGEWEMGHSAGCFCPSCGGREGGSLIFEAETFMEHAEIENFLEGTYRDADGNIVIRSRLKKSDPRKGFEKKMFPGIQVGLKGWERSHSQGAGIGSENPNAIRYAPTEVNQQYQRLGIERYLRDLLALKPNNTDIWLTTVTETHPGTLRLKQIQYRIDEVVNGKKKPNRLVEASIEVANKRVKPRVTINSKPFLSPSFMKELAEF